MLNGHCGIHEQPEVPASDVAKYGINVLVYHNEPLPKYPERTRDGLKRLAMVATVLNLILCMEKKILIFKNACFSGKACQSLHTYML